MIEEYPHSLFGRLKRVSFNGDSVFPLYFAALLDDAIVEAGMSVEPLLDIRCRGGAAGHLAEPGGAVLRQCHR